jgi:hypothetical protein
MSQLTKFCLLCQLIASTFVSANLAAQEKKFPLEVGYDKAQLYQTEIRIEHAGSVAVVSSDEDREVQEYPIDVQGHLKYHERFIGSPSKPQAIRLFKIARAKMKIDKANLNSELAASNRRIVSRIKTEDGNRFQFASVDSVLQQKELELIKNPCDPLSFAGVLNRPEVVVGSNWEPDRDDLARLLSVDRVIYSTVKFEVAQVKDDLAKIHIVGKLKAEVDDTLTDMAIAGVVQLDRQERFVRALRMTINENRRPGQIAPGFDGQTKIDLQTTKAEEVKELSFDELKEIARTKTIRNSLRWVADTGNFELTFDPAWKMISSEGEAAILRFVENGDLLTQCSIVRLPSRPADNPLTLNDFKAEVAKMIAKDANSRIEQVDEITNGHGLRTMKVLVSGEEQEIRMNWLYFNVSDVDGRQVTFVFMLEEQVFPRVASAAQRLIDGFAFHHNDPKQKLNSEKPESRDAKAEVGSAVR